MGNDKVIGSEGIIILDGNVILGMQKPKRWYEYANDKGALIKTIGGQLEDVDNGDFKSALAREITEEIQKIEIDNDDMILLFNKKIRMKDLNPFEMKSELEMSANFYLIKIKDNSNYTPNDLPFLIKIPIEKFLKFEMGKIYNMDMISDYLIKNENVISKPPKYFSFFVPNDAIAYLKNEI